MKGAKPERIHDNGASPALLAGGTHDWKQFEADIPAAHLHDQTRVLFIYLRHDAQKEPRGKAYFDDLTVERLPKGTVFTQAEKIEKKETLSRLLPAEPRLCPPM